MISVEIEKKNKQQNKHSFNSLNWHTLYLFLLQSENFANFILWHFALVKRNDDSEPCYLLGEIHEKKAIISLYKGNVQALKYIPAFELSKPWADRHQLRVAWEQKRKFHQNYFSPVRFLVLFSFQEEVLSMYNLPSTSSCLGYQTSLSSFICRAAQCPASHPSLSARAGSDVPPGRTHWPGSGYSLGIMLLSGCKVWPCGGFGASLAGMVPPHHCCHHGMCGK